MIIKTVLSAVLAFSIGLIFAAIIKILNRDAEIGIYRFIEMHNISYETALSEIKEGHKKSRWMWYIFPELKGLSHSTMEGEYALTYKEATDYYYDSVLGKDLKEISKVLLEADISDITKAFEYPDYIQLRSCMTLFYKVSGDTVFKEVIDKYFNGEMDELTLELIKRRN